MEQSFTLIWKSIADVIRTHVSADTFQRWFAAIRLVGADEERLTLCVPNHIYQLWIESNYMPFVDSAVLATLQSPRAIKFLIARPEDSAAQNGKPAGCDPVPTPEPAPTPVVVDGINRRYTFDTFVVGSNGRFAHAAALAVAQSPARTYNPLFMYGGSGLGKTHLMHAIGQHVVQRKKNTRVVYVSSEKFTNEFIDAIQNNSLVKFRKRYRQADLLLIDDIHFLAEKTRTQEEFFHTFNTLFDGHKQIVLSSDCPPSQIANLEQRLVSRFECGMTAEIQAPDLETRLAILHKKAETLNVKLEDSVFEFLAQRIRSNVRRLEGALMRMASFTSLNGPKLGTEQIEHVLKDILQEEGKRSIDIAHIQRRVAEHYDIRLADMTSKRRPRHIAFPRQVAMYLARELTKASLSEIGEAFGGRDHGTVLHAHRLVREKIADDDKTRQTVSVIDSQLQRA